MTTTAERVSAVRDRIAATCRRCGRDPAGVRLIGAVKGRAPSDVMALIAAGVTELGGNYVQETHAQRAALGAAGDGVRWHLIGHLQRNKAKAALAGFHVIHTIDSPALAMTLHDQLSGACRRDPLDVLIEVNIAGEAAKSGIAPDAAPALVEAVRRLPGLRLLGFMTMAPVAQRAEEARPHFRRLRALRDAIDPALTELSMGMTDDFEAAIEEGATMVRIGRALFEG